MGIFQTVVPQDALPFQAFLSRLFTAGIVDALRFSLHAEKALALQFALTGEALTALNSSADPLLFPTECSVLDLLNTLRVRGTWEYLADFVQADRASPAVSGGGALIAFAAITTARAAENHDHKT